MATVTQPPRARTLGHLLAGLPYRQLGGSLELPVPSLAYHTRQVAPGGLFVALKGSQTDGHRFVSQAVAQGASMIVCQDLLSLGPDITVIQVPDSRLALAHLAAGFYRHPSRELALVGITGTNGKTTTSFILENMFQAAGATVGVMGTVNYRFGATVLAAPVTTPESLDLQQMLRQMRDHDVSHAVLEVSSHALDLRRADCCRFAAAIFTNLSQDHLDYHGDFETYFAAKQRLFTELLANGRPDSPLAVINRDDEWGARLLQAAPRPALSYGLEKPADVRPLNFHLAQDGLQAHLATPFGDLEIEAPLVGRHNLYNVLAASATALGLGLPAAAVVQGLAGLTGVAGRLERVALPGRPVVFVDYAHTPDALEKVLAALAGLHFRRLITVFGCGGDRDRTKRPRMGLAAAQASDLVIITSDNPRTEDPLAIIREIEPGVREAGLPRLDATEARDGASGYLIVPDRRQAIGLAVAVGQAADAILLAGKGHENYQILGTSRIHFDDREEARLALTEGTPA